MNQFDESLESIADHTSQSLIEAATNAAFNLFRNKRFRQHADFEATGQAEHDRIFNELVAAFVTIEMLLLEAPDLRPRQEFLSYLRTLKERIPGAFAQHLKSLGVDSTHVADWKKLLDLRYTEYARDKHEVRKAAMELETSLNSLNVESLSRIQVLLPVQSVAIGCHYHVFRGETEGKDELFKLILRELSKFYVMLRVRLEGGRIGFLARIRARLKHRFR